MQMVTISWAQTGVRVVYFNGTLTEYKNDVEQQSLDVASITSTVSFNGDLIA